MKLGLFCVKNISKPITVTRIAGIDGDVRFLKFFSFWMDVHMKQSRLGIAIADSSHFYNPENHKALIGNPRIIGVLLFCIYFSQTA